VATEGSPASLRLPPGLLKKNKPVAPLDNNAMKAELENKTEVPETFYRPAGHVDGQLRIRVFTDGAVSRVDFTPTPPMPSDCPQKGRTSTIRQTAVRGQPSGECLDALEPEIAVEHTDIPERVNRDVLKKVGEQVAARSLPEKPAATD